MYLLYQLVIALYAALAAPRLLAATLRHGKYRGTLAERWGRLPSEIDPGTSTSIWLHGVSVGKCPFPDRCTTVFPPASGSARSFNRTLWRASVPP